MSIDSSYNAFFPIAINGLNNLVNAIDSTNKTSLKNFGKTELMGDLYIDNGGRLAINKPMNSTTTYYLDVSGNSSIAGDLLIKNKNILSNVQYITGTTTLTFGSAEYIAITSTCPTNSTITLPTVSSTLQIGTKYTFFFNSDSYPTVNIYGATNQTIVDNIYSFSNSFVKISYSRSFVELVCTNYTMNGVCWALSNGANDFDLMPGILSPNDWGNLNTFNSQLPTSTITTFNNNNQFVTKYFTDLTYLKSTDASNNYLKIVDASNNYLKIVDASNNYLKIVDASNNYLKISNATLSYQTISGMSSYATKTYADGLITTLKSSANTWTNGQTFNSSTFINNSSTLKITIGSSLVSDVGSSINIKGDFTADSDLTLNGNENIYGNVYYKSTGRAIYEQYSYAQFLSGTSTTFENGSTLYVNGDCNFNNTTTRPKWLSVDMATVQDITNSPTIYAPAFRSTTQSAGGLICGFQSQNGDSRFNMYDEGVGLTPNCAVIQTLAGNGIGIQAVYGTINNFIGTSLIAQILSTGLSVTGNLSFTGSLGSITQSIFSNIATAFGKQTPSSSGSVITAATTLSPPFSEVYSVFNGATAFTITIPQASAANAGVILCFRRASGSTTTTVVSLTTTGSTQSIYNGVNSGSTTFSMLASGVYIIRFVSITNGTTYGWHQV